MGVVFCVSLMLVWPFGALVYIVCTLDRPFIRCCPYNEYYYYLPIKNSEQAMGRSWFVIDLVGCVFVVAVGWPRIQVSTF